MTAAKNSKREIPAYCQQTWTRMLTAEVDLSPRRRIIRSGQDFDYLAVPAPATAWEKAWGDPGGGAGFIQ